MSKLTRSANISLNKEIREMHFISSSMEVLKFILMSQLNIKTSCS